ncbi:MAG: hypothetical protein M0R23_08865 [Bacteroidales bacterium]|jgi:hypothetical protein|nr:hypothetical protein [Bacteroidales bacterium]
MANSVATNGVFKWIATALVSILLTFNSVTLNNLRLDLKTIDEKIFKHLTNDEIHIPRDYVVSKAEFDLNKKFRDDFSNRVMESICELKKDIREQLNSFNKKK